MKNNLNNNIFKVYIKNAKTGLWTEKRLGENLGHDNYYPYMIINGVEDIRALPVQDDYRPELTQFDYPCFYQYVRYFENNSHKKVVDYSNLEVAKERPQLMEQLDMHLDGNGDIHIITRAWLDDFPDRYKSTYDYLTGSLDNLKRVDTEFLHKRFNWLRFFEYKGKMYMAGSTHEKAAIIDIENRKTWWLDIKPEDIRGSYIFTNSKRSGSDTDKYLDIYFVPANKGSYNHDALYIRIDLSENL
jgi:hypothetical protein